MQAKNPHRSSLYERLTGADKARILQQAKIECENLIQTRLEILPSIYVNKREFDTFRTSVSKTYLPADTFTSYRKHQENRLKSIDEKLNYRFSLLTINLHNRKDTDGHKSYILLDSIIHLFKHINPRWLLSVLVFLSLCMIAIGLYSSIST